MCVSGRSFCVCMYGVFILESAPGNDIVMAYKYLDTAIFSPPNREQNKLISNLSTAAHRSPLGQQQLPSLVVLGKLANSFLAFAAAQSVNQSIMHSYTFHTH